MNAVKIELKTKSNVIIFKAYVEDNDLMALVAQAICLRMGILAMELAPFVEEGEKSLSVAYGELILTLER